MARYVSFIDREDQRKFPVGVITTEMAILADHRDRLKSPLFASCTPAVTMLVANWFIQSFFSILSRDFQNGRHQRSGVMGLKKEPSLPVSIDFHCRSNWPRSGSAYQVVDLSLQRQLFSLSPIKSIRYILMWIFVLISQCFPRWAGCGHCLQPLNIRT